MYVKQDGDTITSDNNFRVLAQNVSFAPTITDEELETFGIYKAVDTLDHDPATQKLTAIPPILVNGTYHAVRVDDLTLDEVKARALATVATNFAAKVAGGFSYGDNTYDIDTTAQLNMTSVEALFQRGLTGAHGGKWRTRDNVDVTMTDEEVRTFFVSAAAFKMTLIRTAQTVKDAILQADTVAAVVAVDKSLEG